MAIQKSFPKAEFFLNALVPTSPTLYFPGIQIAPSLKRKRASFNNTVFASPIKKIELEF
jgi:hypothetical protein